MALFNIDEVQPHEDRESILRILNHHQSDEGDFTVRNPPSDRTQLKLSHCRMWRQGGVNPVNLA